MKKKDNVNYACDECGAKYKRFGALENHLREKYDRLSSTTFIRDVCMKVIDRIKKLNCHVITHV